MDTVFFSFLTDDLLFIILLCLPPDILFNVCRFVSRRFYNIIKSPNFIAAHLAKQSTSNSLLLHEIFHFPYILKPTVHSFVFDAKHLNLHCFQKVSATCNGLILFFGSRPSSCYSCYVANPVVKQFLPLPVFPHFPDCYRKHCISFGYCSSSKVYKVLHFSEEVSNCIILTVGVDDQWRQINANSNISDYFKELIACAYHSMIDFKCSVYSVTIGEFVFWLCQEKMRILCFNLETEIFDEIMFPSQKDLSNCNCSLIEMDGSLCCWVWTRDQNNYLFEFWLLKDNGLWLKRCIDFMDDRRLHPFNYTNFRLIGWFGSMEQLVFYGDQEVYVYNVKTQELYHCDDKKPNHSVPFGNTYYLGSYVESLVPLTNLSLVTNPIEPYRAQYDNYLRETMISEFQNDNFD